ncbi:MAG TPA: hypothetical protein VKV19_19690 [Ktedonobacteraceae bacterium]|nr:hypothetical protein [Ktedonobacteraceae bacterium]
MSKTRDEAALALTPAEWRGNDGTNALRRASFLTTCGIAGKGQA